LASPANSVKSILMWPRPGVHFIIKMAIKNLSLKEALVTWPSKPIAWAFAVNIALIGYLEGGTPDLLSILIGFASMVGVAYLMKPKLGVENLIGTIGTGAVAYAAYSIVLTLTKVSTAPFIMQDEAIMAVSFGLLAGLVYQIMQYFGK